MKKTKDEELLALDRNIRDESVSKVLEENFLPYSLSVIVSRALPEIDGLKPSHRKLLYTMYRMGLLSGARTKSANIASQTMLLNPHGDAANYETMVRLTDDNETLLAPLVDGKGNFGKHYSRDMAYSASRYTEAKLAPIAAEFFKSINKNTVEFVDNYDATKKEPVLLPVTFPNILANPTQGIAVGMASNIPSFNLKELCDAAILRIKHPQADILSVMPAPDFTTGGYILYEEAVMRSCYRSGVGTIRLKSKYRVDKKERVIEVYEIPYSTSEEAIIEGVIDCIKTGKAREINDVRDETDKGGLKIAIEYKRGIDPEELMKKLFKLTKLQDTYAFNLNLLIDGHPKTLGVAQILDEWIKWRRECVVRELSYDLSKKTHELHLLEGLEKLLLDIDKAIAIIRASENDEAVIRNLMKGFSIDEEQAQFIAEIKLRNLNKEYILNRTKDMESLEADIDEINRILSSGKAVDKEIIKTLQEVSKKYGKPRRSEIIEYHEEIVTIEVPDYQSNIYVTRDGYLKKVPLTSLRTSPEIKLKEGDEIVKMFEISNRSEIVIFSNKCNVYKMLVKDIADCKPSDLGEYMNNLVQMEAGESPLAVYELKPDQKIVIGFENGKCAKFPASVYETKQNRKKLINAYSDRSAALGLYMVPEDTRFVFFASNGNLLPFTSKDIPEKASKTTQGIQTMRVSKKGLCTAFKLAEEIDMTDLPEFHYRSLPSAGLKGGKQLKIDL